MLTFTRRLLQLLMLLAPLFILILLAVLAATFFSPEAAGKVPVAGAERVAGTRIALVWIIAMALLGLVVLHRLLGIVTAAKQGDPFIPDNARRLREIGMALLGIEVIRWLGALLLWFASAQPLEPNVEASLDLVPWLAILLAFVLARVFEVGTRLRDDAALTV